MATSILEKNNVRTFGSGTDPIVFAHGFGCDQHMWKFVAPAFEETHRVVLYDLTGAGNSDLSAYDFDAYDDLAQHAQDMLEICDALKLEAPVVVGHSVSAITAGLAAVKQPDRFSRIAMVSPSPCFINKPVYHGGFEHDEMLQVIDFMQQNYLGWADQMAPTIAGKDAGDPASEMLTQSFCRTDPDIARHFGKVTFLSDKRAEMAKIEVPTLVIQCSNDALAPVSVGQWMADTIRNGEIAILDTVGHCPHLTAPQATTDAIRQFIAQKAAPA